MNLWRMVLKVIVILSLAIVSRTALAGCSVTKYPPSFIAKVSASFTVAQNQKPGTTIGSAISLTTSPAYGLGRVDCASSAYYLYFYQISSTMVPSGVVAIDNNAMIYKTNIDGIGIQIKSNAGIVVGPSATLWQSPYCYNCHDLSALPAYKLQFYVTGPVQTGDVSLNSLINGLINDRNTSSGATYYGYLSITGTVKFKAGSCKTPDISVNLGKHSADSFTSVGSTSAPVPFNFQINECDPGLATVSYTFKPASGVTLEGAAGSEYLTLKGSQKAGGIGVQMFYDDGVTPVPFNSKTAFSGYETTTGGSYVIPMQARYVRTGKVSAGPANSAVEFVMAYE